MQYWWVNQKQTFKYEFEGGYLWSPKRKTNGARNPFYEFMRNVVPGDFIFSYANAEVCAIGIANSNAYEAPKPSEFGSAGPNWEAIGWRVDVRFYMLDNRLRPVEHLNQISPELSYTYSPLQASGRGNQSMYLTFVTPRLAEILISLIGEEAWRLRKMFDRISGSAAQNDLAPAAQGLVQWEEHLINTVRDDGSLSDTEKETLVMARRGQGVFKQNVLGIEKSCRITKVDKIEHLRASHIKPWRDCKDQYERLTAENGLLLTPSIDHLFDRGFISFEDNGELLVSPAAHEESLQRMGVQTGQVVNTGSFNQMQKRYLDFHRNEVFLKARVQV